MSIDLSVVEKVIDVDEKVLGVQYQRTAFPNDSVRALAERSIFAARALRERRCERCGVPPKSALFLVTKAFEASA